MDNISYIYTGNFNPYFNNIDNPPICTFNELPDCFDLTNDILFATNASGNTLDLVILGDRDIMQHVDQGYKFSAHLAVNFELRMPRPTFNKMKISS